MSIRKSLLATLATSALIAAGSAYAGPPVTVTFKHLGGAGSESANYTTTNANETSTNLNASPKPLTPIAAGGSDTYLVQSKISPDTNFASVRYTIGSKTCVFSTTFLNALNSTGVKVPQWNKTATPSGGATCTATITSTNFSTFGWAVQFTMK